MLDLNKIYCCDCVDGISRLDDGCIDLVVTSPPYDDLREYNGYTFDCISVAKGLFMVVKQGGVVVWVVGDKVVDGNKTLTSFKQALIFQSVGFNVHDVMIYKKMNTPFMRSNAYTNCFEYMFILSKGKPDHFTFLMEDSKHAGKSSVFHQRNPDGSMRDDRKIVTSNNVCKEKKPLGNVWSINTIASNSEKTGHPAQFPVQLAQDHVVSWSYENDVVLDCFMGSGTTGVACVKTKRNFIGIELDESYFDIAKKRIEKEESEISRKLF